MKFGSNAWSRENLGITSAKISHNEIAGPLRARHLHFQFATFSRPTSPKLVATMSDNGEVEVENPVSSWPVLPKEVNAELGSIKLFNSGLGPKESTTLEVLGTKLTASRVVIRGC